MSGFQNISVWVIRNWNLGIVWDLVLVIWCFYCVTKLYCHVAHHFIKPPMNNNLYLVSLPP
jgi:hypothetical protein